MIPTKLIEDALANQLATDTATLAIATFIDVGLVINPFVPGAGLVIADIVITGAAGLAAKTTTSAVMVVGRDPVTGDYIIVIPPPAGGWVWVAGGGGLPLTIYGFAAVDHATPANIFGSELLPTPILINTAGQLFDMAEVSFRLPSGIMT